MERRLKVRIEPHLAGMTVEQVLRRKLGMTKREISQIKFRPGGLRIAGQQVRVTHVLTEGEILEILLEEAERGSCHLKASEGKLQILYEDEELVAVNKPAGLVVHPSHGHYEDSLANQLVGHYRRNGQEVTVRSIGRLDKDTSGVLLFGKYAQAAARLCRQREEHIYQRWYLALATGRFHKKRGKLTGRIGPKTGDLYADGSNCRGETCGYSLSGTEPGERIYPSGVSTGDRKNSSDTCTYGLCGTSVTGGSSLRGWKRSF